MRRVTKWGLYVGSAVFALATVAAGLGYWWLARSLPDLDGERRLPGLVAPASIVTDRHGIPLISADSRVDAARVLGYLTARDRLFQMDLMRRKNAGLLAEIFGGMALPSDIQARTYGFSDLAWRVLTKLPQAHRDYLEAYADGVNSYLAQNPVLPFEFDVLSYRPEPWKPEHSLLIVLGMFENLTAWVESGERMLSVMAQTLPVDVVEFLTPDSDRYTDSLMRHALSLRPPKPVPVAALQTLLARRAAATGSLAAAPALTLAGSNAWAVAGAKTVDGRAILANDMHLGISVPNIWYRVELDYPKVRAAGLNLPGTPILVVGSNRHVAWGMTNLAGDFLDLVRLEINPDDADQYRVGAEWRAFGERRETISVKGGESKIVTVRETIWGPVARQDLLGRSVAIHWSALDADAVNLEIMALEQSETLSQALDIANRGGGPQLNVLLADDAGHIAWTVTGKIPRRFGGDGAVSRSWADAQTGWRGYLAPGEMPRVIDPPEGYLLSANERRFAADFPVPVGHQFAPGFRAYRINQRLAQMTQPSEWTLFNLQQDTDTEFYAYYQQLALQLLTPEVLAQRPALSGLRDYLLSWNGRADTGSLGLPVLIEFRKQLIDTVFTPFLSACKQADPSFVYAWSYVDTPLQALLNARPAVLLPDPGARSWEAFLLARLEASAAAVASRFPGLPLMELTWGRQNVVGHAHPFSKAVSALADLLDMPRQPLAGCGGYCVRVTGPDFGASERLIVSPNHFQEAILHMPGGQSGHPLSPYYRDQQPYWLAGLPLALTVGRPEHTLLFNPVPAAGQNSAAASSIR
ncbi:penicillin acylase family protein [Methylomonas sp. UP202]|uniref:penicillin acylase family protein n=1 Tax=Methylomonas sp. UP202 TaxID=3040943 RepID=UPI00247A9810|nr:penicillin acylase family protein [Methylomonas sp. UP202]WGS87257.1 penicillin acylase family protein [Methylomonas sp. UP202]